MARPSGFRKGGGFLNDVDGTWMGYQFTDEFNGQAFVAGKVKDKRTGKLKDKFHAVYLVPEILVDGAEKPITTTIFVGGFEDYEISEDGLTITPVEGAGISVNSDLGRLVTSICENGFDETELPEGVEINFEAFIGRRMRFVKAKDEDKTKKLGKRVDSKTGREYDYDYLTVSQVYPSEQRAQTPTKGRATKPATSAPATTRTVATGGKPNGASKDVDIAELASERLKGYLKAAGGSFPKSKISLKILQDAELRKLDLRDEVKTWLFDDENLGSIEGVTYDVTSKTQTVALEG